MAVRAMTTVDVVDYVSDLDPSKKKKWVKADLNDPNSPEVEVEDIQGGATHFGLRPLDLFLQAWIYDSAQELETAQGSNMVGIKTRMNQTNVDAVRFGVAYVKNYQGSDKKPITAKFNKVSINGMEYDALDDSILKTFGIKLVQELANRIKEISEVTAEEEKNSAVASLQSA